MGQMRLNDVVTEIVAEVVAGKAIKKRQAAVDRWHDIDDDGQYLAGIEGVVSRIEDRARMLRVRSEKNIDDAQPKLPFQLPAAVAMDLEGTTLVSTRALSREEFERAIEIRKLQIANDTRALREWRQALQQANRFWAQNPDWSFGACLDAIMAGTSIVITGGAA